MKQCEWKKLQELHKAKVKNAKSIIHQQIIVPVYSTSNRQLGSNLSIPLENKGYSITNDEILQLLQAFKLQQYTKV